MKVYEVRLEKVISNHGFLGVDKVDGIATDLPSVGKRFKIFIDEQKYGVDYVETTPIQNLERIDKEYRIHTANSSYHVTILHDYEEC